MSLTAYLELNAICNNTVVNISRSRVKTKECNPTPKTGLLVFFFNKMALQFQIRSSSCYINGLETDPSEMESYYKIRKQ